MNDIDMSYVSDFKPIGAFYTDMQNLPTIDKPFSGIFDGGGYTISNLSIDMSRDSVGLFGYNKGTIKNVKLADVNVSGGVHVGALVGYNYNGTVENCTVSGKVNGSNTTVGGLVGDNTNGTVNGNFNGTVSGGQVVGGLVGYNGGTVSGCTVTSTVSGTGKAVGALFGDNSGSASNNKFYSTNLTDIGEINGGTGSDNTRHYKIDYKTDAVKNIVTVTGNPDTITDSKTTYYAGEVTLKEKTGYVFSANDTAITGTGFTITEDTTVTATFDTNSHYVFKDGDTYTLATATNTTAYPELVQVYELTLPDGITAEGALLTDGNKAYVTAGSVTLTSNLSVGYVLDSGNTFNVDKDMTVGVIFDEKNHYVFQSGNTYTLATKENATGQALTQVYELNLSEGVKATVTEGQAFKVGKATYYSVGAVVKLTDAPGYEIENISVDDTEFTGETFTVTKDSEVTADLVYIFNKTDTATATGVTVMKQSGNLSTYNGIYSISASQQNSTLTGNNNNNTIILTGGGIVTDFGIGATKSGDGTVSGVYFDRDASTKNDAKFTAIVTYDSTSDGSADEVIVLQNISKKPTKYGSNPVYQTNDAAAATLKALFRDDSELSDLSSTVQTQLVKLDGIGDLNLPAVDALNQNTQATYSGDNG